MSTESEVIRWAHSFGVTRERLRHAVFKVGTLIDQLRDYLSHEPRPLAA